MKKEAMNRMGVKGLFYVVFAVVLLLLSSFAAWAQMAIHDAQTTDVTSSGFAVVWRTSEAATPQIAVFSDPAETVEITSELEVTLIPLYGGNPEAFDEFSRDNGIEDLRDSAKTLGLMKVAVQGCLPQTTYYFRVFADNGVENVQWPGSEPASVTTMRENAFVQDSKQILVTLADNLGSVDFEGWLLTVSSNEAFYPVSSYVGDGGGPNQAYLDLSNLFDPDEDNWTPTGLQVVTIEVRMPDSDPIHRGLTLLYTDEFKVSTVSKAEINIDEAGDVTAPVVFPSLPGGTYSTAQNISISADEEAFIFFTTDDSEPTIDSALYTDPIEIGLTTTLKFMAVDRAGNQSAVDSELYTITDNLPPFGPTAPEPVDGATLISIETELTWQSQGDPDPADVVSYDVYLWAIANSDPPVCSDQSTLTCLTNVLQFDTIYFWQVVAKDSYGEETAGPVWRFMTFSENGDEDMDGLSNGDEIFWGSDPFDWDTDKDGHRDGDEIAWGSDPTDDESVPNIDCEGDFNFDSDVDASDLGVFADAFDSIVGDARFNAAADFDGDDHVGDSDLIIFAQDYGRVNCPYVVSPADLDGDGDVDEQDLNEFISALGSCVGSSWFMGAADYDQDGCITNMDYVLWYSYFENQGTGITGSGDIDGDGDVDSEDFQVIENALGRCVGDADFVLAADYDGDGCITNSDYTAWYGYYNPN